VDLAGVKGSGPNGRIVKADVEARSPAPPRLLPLRLRLRRPGRRADASAPAALPDFGIPHEDQPLSACARPSRAA
jgi:pyruvate dehydrogenase E2 component (dihydrolipoamide acetyltransferase)